MAETTLFESGELRFFVGPGDRKNEVLIEGKNDFIDPVKLILLAAPQQHLKGTFAFGSRRLDGEIEELAFFKGGQNEEFRDNPFNFSGELEFFCRHHSNIYQRDDDQWHRIMRMRYDAVDIYKKVIFHQEVINKYHENR